MGTRLLWRKLCPNNLLLVALVFVVLSAIRAYGFWGAEFNGKYLMGAFLLMWFVPWIFLNRTGRKAMGLTLPQGYRWILLAPLVGGGMAFVGYWLGDLLYGASAEHWYITISQSFLSDERVLGMPVNQLFLMFTIPAVIFSPIGEELLFRGFIHQSVQERWSWTSALVVNAVLFACVHLLHHGIVKNDSGWSVLWVSGFIWFLLMFITSVGFSWLRLKYDSLIPAILAHSIFNLVMNYTIFFILL